MGRAGGFWEGPLLRGGVGLLAGGAAELLRTGLDPTGPSEGRDAASGFSRRGDFWAEGVRSWGGGGGLAEAGGAGGAGGGTWAHGGEGSAFSRPSGFEEVSEKINGGGNNT